MPKNAEKAVKEEETIAINRISNQEFKNILEVEIKTGKGRTVTFKRKFDGSPQKISASENKVAMLNKMPTKSSKTSEEDKIMSSEDRHALLNKNVAGNKKTVKKEKNIANIEDFCLGHKIVPTNVKKAVIKTEAIAFVEETTLKEFPVLPAVNSHNKAEVLSQTMSEVMQKLYLSLCLPQEEIVRRRGICQKIHRALKPYFPHSELKIYGSSLNGCGTIVSDLDLLFLPSPYYEVKYDKLGKIRRNKGLKCPMLKDVDDRNYPVEKLISLDPGLILKFILPLVQKTHLSKKVLFIPARCPILTFQCKQTKLNCDIACGNRIVFHNTELIRFYMSIDPRAHMLVMILRYWAKSVMIIKKGILSSYAFTLLIIFFLQNTEPPVFPTVNHLKLSGSPYFIDGWNVGFTTDKNKIRKSSNIKSPGELMKEFFLFYLEFDFLNNVICPNTGNCMTVKQLRGNVAKNKQPGIFKMKAINIQDPFILSHNVSQMNKMTLRVFRSILFSTLTVLAEIDHYNCTQKFYSLFNRDESENSILLNFDPKTLKSMECNIYAGKLTSSVICNALLELLQEGLFFDCTVKPLTRVDDDFSNNAETELRFLRVMSVHVEIYNLTYNGRRKTEESKKWMDEFHGNSDSLDCENKFLRKEKLLSTFILQNRPALCRSESFYEFNCDCYEHIPHKYPKIQIVLRSLTQGRRTNMIRLFLFNYLSTNIYKYLSNM